MRAQTESGNNLEIEKDVCALRAYRRSRVQFGLRLTDASCDQTPAVLEVLRTDATYQVAEFYFLLSGFAIRTVSDFDALIERHNIYVSELLSDNCKMNRMGLTQERLLRAIFDGDTRPRVLKLWTDQPGTLDQTSLARFLVAVMSDETARKVAVACGKAGFLTRQASVFKLMLLVSTGKLEAIYGECLRETRLEIQAIS